MFDFRLKVFHTVAKRLNFTRAAQELFITQPAVTKHIKEIESYLQIQLFERNGTKIALTTAGETLYTYTEKLFEVYRQLEIDISTLRNVHAGKLRLGASTTIANYILPLVLPSFKNTYPDINVELQIDNTEGIEKALLNKHIDLGITEGYAKSYNLKYSNFLQDEIVVVANSKHPLALKPNLNLDDLKRASFLMRESGSGTLDVIGHALAENHIKITDLTTEMELRSSESIKLYLLNSNSLAFLSVYAILNELKHNLLQVLDVDGVAIQRYFYFVEPQGQTDKLVDVFIKFASSYNYR